MGYLLVDDLHLDRVVVFVLTGYKHSGDSNDMEISHFAGALLILEVPIL